eukprot:235480-Rhodomonas_salina.1
MQGREASSEWRGRADVSGAAASRGRAGAVLYVSLRALESWDMCGDESWDMLGDECWDMCGKGIWDMLGDES